MAAKNPAEIVWESAKGIMYNEAYSILRNRADSEDAVMEAMVFSTQAISSSPSK